MKPIDFDGRFRRFAEQWMLRNRSKFPNADRMEEAFAGVYLRWINRPAPWLGGTSPAGYFTRLQSPEALTALLRAYGAEGVPVPDLLISRLGEFGPEAAGALESLAFDEGAADEPRAAAMNLLTACGAESPMPRCVERIRACEAGDEFAELAADLLRGLGAAAIPAMLDALNKASEAGAEIFIELLCNFPGDDRIYTIAIDRFERTPGKRAQYASYLGKLMDPRAIGPLTRSLEAKDLGYLDYIEIVNAIEALGGDAPEGRDFTGDPHYESLKHLS